MRQILVFTVAVLFASAVAATPHDPHRAPPYQWRWICASPPCSCHTGPHIEQPGSAHWGYPAPIDGVDPKDCQEYQREAGCLKCGTHWTTEIRYVGDACPMKVPIVLHGDCRLQM